MRIATLNPKAKVPSLMVMSTARIKAIRSSWQYIQTMGQYRREHPLCERCQANGGIITRAVHAHHIVPMLQGGATTAGNLLAVCKACHEGIDSVPIDVQKAWKSK